MVWLALFTILVAGMGWLYLSIGSRTIAVPTVDRALVAIPAGLVLMSVVSFLGNWPFGVRFSRLSLLAWAALPVAALLLLTRTRLPVSFWPIVGRPSRSNAAVVVVGSVVLVGFTTGLSIVLLTRPIFGWDFYLYHWHYARILFETGSLPTQVSPSFFEAEYAYPPLMMLAYGDISHMLGQLSQLGPRLLPLLFAVGTAVVCGRIARVCLGLSVAASLAAAGFALWSGYYFREILMENTDTINSFFTVAALYWLIRRDVPPLPRLLGGGLLLAGAYWTRYNGLLALAMVPTVSLLAMAARGAVVDRRKELGVAAGALGVALILASPHLVRNLVLWGNPVYPALAKLLGGHLIDQWVILTTLPIWQPVPFFGLMPGWWHHPFDTFPETGPTLAIIVAAFPLVLTRLWRGALEGAQLLAAILLYSALYVVFLRGPSVGDSERYLIPVVAMAAPLAGAVFEELTRVSWLSIWALLTGFFVLRVYVDIDRVEFFSDMNRILLLLIVMVFAISAVLFVVRKLSRWAAPWQLQTLASMRLQLLPIMALPFFGIWMATQHPCVFVGYCDPSVVISGGLQRVPETGFIDQLGGRYLSFDDRRELIGGDPFPGDHPSLERFYVEHLQGAAAVQALKALGVRYIYTSGRLHNPLMLASPMFSQLDNPQLFRRIYVADQTVAIYELR
ncbi:MAG TPA: hypothetical protein VJT14_04690 [Candidatus Dormibacteraeota bacterium]|nr:hypothetical protein [Candidatus Dormibacteraeota bacterium]